LVEFGKNILILIKTAVICTIDVTFNSIIKKIGKSIRLCRTDRG